MPKSKFVKGRVYVDGARIENINEFKAPPLKKETLEVETIETKFTAYNNYKFESPEGTIKLNGPIQRELLGKFFQGGQIQIQSKQLYQEWGALGQGSQISGESGVSWEITALVGGFDQDAITSGEGGMMEIGYTAVQVSLKDRNSAEIVAYNFITNELRINGESQSSDFFD